MLRECLTPVAFCFGTRQHSPIAFTRCLVERCVHVLSEVFCPVFPFCLLLHACSLLEAIWLRYLARICSTWRLFCLIGRLNQWGKHRNDFLKCKLDSWNWLLYQTPLGNCSLSMRPKGPPDVLLFLWQFLCFCGAK